MALIIYKFLKICYNHHITKEKIYVCINLFREIGKGFTTYTIGKNAIGISIDNLKTKLNNHFEDEITEILIFGSYNRHTNLCRKADEDSDVDIMVVFKNLGYKPQTYIDKLKNFMEARYSSSEIHQSNPCAILELQHIKFELTPAIWAYNKTYKIPDKANSCQDWIYTEPFKLDYLASSKEHSRYPQVSRLVKYWNCLNKKFFPSYELENIVLDTDLYFYTETLQDNLFKVLKSIKCLDDYPEHVKQYIEKTQKVIKDIEDDEETYPNLCESLIKTLFLELD